LGFGAIEWRFDGNKVAIWIESMDDKLEGKKDDNLEVLD
jgi:hypothetical protein